MQKNILIGNGINIQFGGADYTNTQIMKRVASNITSNKYIKLFPDILSDELMSIFDGIRSIIANIGKIQPPEEYLFLLMEIDRIQKSYSSDVCLEDIAMEDLFIALEYLWKESDSDEFRNNVHRELQQILLDAIYNDGKIQELDYGSGMERFLRQYDNIFTVNYDCNLEKYAQKPVFHLHGDFNTLAPEFDQNSQFSINNPEKCLASQVVPGFEHTFSNTIMSWYWLEKYGAWLENNSYGKSVFESMEGTLDIIGISPNNDFQLFYTVNQSKIKSVTYYYKSNNDRNKMNSCIRKSTTFASVDRLWRTIC